jgi:uncharacterized protein (TIGR03437 family)
MSSKMSPTIPRLLLLVCLLGASAVAQGPRPGGFTTAQTLTDEAQRTTLAFSGLAMMTGNLEAQSFFPPGKVADYTGFQYLRDNDPDEMGHNTSFLTRVANNVIYVLDDAQFAQLKTLAAAQQDQIDLYGYKRFPLMKAFRRLLEGDTPAGLPGLSLSAVKKASRELYRLDGQISFDRALLYARILGSLTSAQKARLDSMKGKGWKSWPDITDDQIRGKMAGLPQGTGVAVMTYASDLFSWFAGSVEADVYFCPERHGTYYGSFYIKDAPAVGHEGYSIDEQLTATAGAVLSDSSLGYVTAEQAAHISGLVETQRNNLYAGTANIVGVRTEIATLLRGLLVSTESSDDVKARVLALSDTYGDLDGENNYAYATVFAKVYKTLSVAQKAKLLALRQKIMSGAYADGNRFDYSVCETPFLYSSVIPTAALQSYIANTDYLFQDSVSLVNGASFLEGAAAPGALLTVLGESEFASDSAQASGTTLPLVLAGAGVEITDGAGTTRPCGLYYVSPHQINLVVPEATAPGAATVTVTREAGAAVSAQLTIAALAPGLFSLDGSIGAIAGLRISAAGQREEVPIYLYDRRARQFVLLPVDLGEGEDQVYLSLYATGIRKFSSLADLSVTIGGIPVPVIGAAAQPEFAALDQVNIGPLPQSLSGKGVADLVLTAGGEASNPVKVNIQ